MRRIALSAAFVLCLGCGEGSSDSADKADAPIPSPVPGHGQLQFSVDANTDPASVEGYVVGDQEQLKIERSGDTHYINNIPPGTEDIVVTAGTLGVQALTAEKDRGLRKNEVEVTADSVTYLSQLTIPVAGSVSGVVTLTGALDHSGIDIFIPGTSYIAKSDKDGKYSVSNVPVGVHSVQYQFQSFTDVVTEDVTVNTAANTELPPVAMIPTVVQGYLRVKDCDCLQTEETRPVVKIVASESAFQMRLSSEATFVGVPFEAFVEEFTLPAAFALVPGENTIYLQLQDKTGVTGAVTKNVITLGDGSATDPLAAAPTSDLSSGSFTGNQLLTLTTSEAGGSIRYTTDGSEPTASSTLYEGPIGISCAEPATIKAITVASGRRASRVLQVDLTFTGACPIVLYATTATFNGNLGGRAGADAKCADEQPSDLICGGVLAFLSTSTPSVTFGALSGASYGDFDASRSVIGYGNDQTIWSAYSNIGTVDPGHPFSSTFSGVLGNYWTGVTGNTMAAGANCNNWTSSAGGDTGQVGDPASTMMMGAWAGFGAQACSNTRALICMCR